MKARLIYELQWSPTCQEDWQYFEQHGHFRKIPAGTILDHPQAFLHVRLGNADPADEECEKAAGMTMEQIKTAQHHQDYVRHGIWPEDYQAFDDGLMIGYNPDGTNIPGPNALPQPDEELTISDV